MSQPNPNGLTDEQVLSLLAQDATALARLASPELASDLTAFAGQCRTGAATAARATLSRPRRTPRATGGRRHLSIVPEASA